MDFSDFFRNQVPLAGIAGIAFALINQAFRFSWRLAQVERDNKTNEREIERVEEESFERHEELVECLKPLPRIEAAVTQLMEDRRSGQGRGGAAL